MSGPYFPVFGPNTEKNGPEITPYLDTFHAYLLVIYLIVKLKANIVFSSMRDLIEGIIPR